MIITVPFMVGLFTQYLCKAVTSLQLLKNEKDLRDTAMSLAQQICTLLPILQAISKVAETEDLKDSLVKVMKTILDAAHNIGKCQDQNALGGF